MNGSATRGFQIPKPEEEIAIVAELIWHLDVWTG